MQDLPLHESLKSHACTSYIAETIFGSRLPAKHSCFKVSDNYINVYTKRKNQFQTAVQRNVSHLLWGIPHSPASNHPKHFPKEPIFSSPNSFHAVTPPLVVMTLLQRNHNRSSKWHSIQHHIKTQFDHTSLPLDNCTPIWTTPESGQCTAGIEY